MLDDALNITYKTYERHFSHIVEKAAELVQRMHTEVLHGAPAQLSISGSAGMGLADACGVPFVQEVFATRVAAKRYAPDANVVIELGGEDAKILFLITFLRCDAPIFGERRWYRRSLPFADN